MTEGESLYLLLIILHLGESAFWVSRDSVAFVRRGFGRTAAAFADAALSNRQGGVRFGGLLPPFAPTFLGRQTPVSVSPDTVTAAVGTLPRGRVRPERETLTVALDGIRSMDVAGRNLLVNDRRLVRADDPAEARRLHDLLATLADAPREARAAAIDRDLGRRFDVAEARERRARVVERTAGLCLVANLLFLHLFVAIPVLSHYLGSVWRPALLAMVLLQFTAAFLFFRGHRALSPERRGDRIVHTLSVAFYPPAAMSAADRLSRPALAEFHPLAVGAAVLPEARFSALAAPLLRDAVHPLSPPPAEPDSAAAEAVTWYRDRVRSVMEDVLRNEGVAPDDLLTIEAPGDGSTRSTCPRCRAGYTLEAGRCTDCGVELVAGGE